MNKDILYSALTYGAIATVFAGALAVHGMREGPEDPRVIQDTQEYEVNHSGTFFNLPYDDSSEFVAACDGANRVYVDKDGSGRPEVVADSAECVDEPAPKRDVYMTFGDNEARDTGGKNDIIATCDGETRIYRSANPRDHDIERWIVAVPDSSACADGTAS